MILDHVWEKLRAVTAEIDQEMARLSAAQRAATAGSVEERRAERGWSECCGQLYGVHLATVIVADAYGLRNADLREGALRRALADAEPIRDDDERTCEKCGEHPATHVTVDDLLCAACVPPRSR